MGVTLRDGNDFRSGLGASDAIWRVQIRSEQQRPGRKSLPSHMQTMMRQVLYPITVSRARSVVAYLLDMSPPSLCGSLHSGCSLRFIQQTDLVRAR